MTVKELKEQLNQFPDCSIVLISSGDDYTPATSVSIGCNELDGCVFIDDCEDEEDCDPWDDYDWCYECTGYGDDYSYDEDGELISNCDDCPNNPNRHDDWDD